MLTFWHHKKSRGYFLSETRKILYMGLNLILESTRQLKVKKQVLNSVTVVPEFIVHGWPVRTWYKPQYLLVLYPTRMISILQVMTGNSRSGSMADIWFCRRWPSRKYLKLKMTKKVFWWRAISPANKGN